MVTRKIPGFALIADVLPGPDPTDDTVAIQMFYAAPNPVAAGKPVVLFFEVTNVPQVRIVAQGFDSGIIATTGSGFLVLDSAPPSTTTYVLSALDSSGNILTQNGSEVTAALTVAVL